MAGKGISHYNQLFNNLKANGPVSPIVLLVGEEDYLKKVAISRIEEFLGVKRIVFFGKDTTVDEILGTVTNTGLFAAKRLIVIYEFEKLKQKDDLLRMRIPDGTYIALVISSSYDKRKLKNLLGKYRNLKHIDIYEFSSLDYKGFTIWVKSRLKRNNKEADDRILELLVKKLPQDLSHADMELKKLFLYMDDDRFLDKHHLSILSYVSEYPLQNTLFDVMGYEKFNTKKIKKAMLNRKTNEIVYEMETHFARIIDAALGTFFSDRYRSEWRIRPYKKHKMLHTLKDASIVMKRLIEIEYATKTNLRDEKITKNLIILSLLP